MCLDKLRRRGRHGLTSYRHHFPRRDAKAGTMGSQRSVGVGKTSVRIRGTHDKHKATLLSATLDSWLVAPSRIKPEDREFVVHSHAAQERFEISRTGYSTTQQKSSRQMVRCQQTRKRRCTSKIWIYSCR